MWNPEYVRLLLDDSTYLMCYDGNFLVSARAAFSFSYGLFVTFALLFFSRTLAASSTISNAFPSGRKSKMQEVHCCYWYPPFFLALMYDENNPFL